MKKVIPTLVFFGLILMISNAQITTTGSLVEFRIKQFNYTLGMEDHVKVTQYEKQGVKYMDIELSPLDESVEFTGEIFGYRLYNVGSDDVSWQTSLGEDYFQISNYIFLSKSRLGVKLYLIQEGINEGEYNSNVLIVLMPHSFTL